MVKTLPVRKIIGAAMMFAGGVPLALLLSIFLLFLIGAFVPDIFITAIGALFTAVGATVLWKQRRRWLSLVVLAVGVAFSCWLGITVWNDRNQLSKYGVSYDITSGEHEEYQTIWFHWNRNGKSIEGPMIWGDGLDVQFKYVAHENVPQIVVRSETYKERSVTLRLNFNDPSKPEFELVEDTGMRMEYCVPWSDFYDEKEKTNE